MPRPTKGGGVAAGLVSAAGERPRPPKHLNRIGKDLWLNIVGSKPVDYFQQADIPQLEEVCIWEQVARELFANGLTCDEDEKRYARAKDKQRAALRGLRLTKQASWQANTRAQDKTVTPRPWDMDRPNTAAKPTSSGVH